MSVAPSDRNEFKPSLLKEQLPLDWVAMRIGAIAMAPVVHRPGDIFLLDPSWTQTGPGVGLSQNDLAVAKEVGSLISKGNTMLSWAITFLVIAIIAAVLGFGGIAGTAAGIAKVLFFVFLVLFVVSLIFGRGRAA
jgi:uncharacterized membrane protein YtjA (UPF0391 family)